MTEDIIKSNPLLKQPILCVLDICANTEDANRIEVEEQAARVWQGDFRQSPSVVVDILIRQGYLEKTLFVDGEPYDGNLEDLQLDDTVSEDAEAVERLVLTESGENLAAAYKPERTLQNLLNEKPDYAPVFLALLEKANNGATRTELESVVTSFPSFATDPTSGTAKVYPQYFIDALETAGGLVWADGWHTTSAAASFLAA